MVNTCMALVGGLRLASSGVLSPVMVSFVQLLTVKIVVAELISIDGGHGC